MECSAKRHGDAGWDGLPLFACRRWRFPVGVADADGHVAEQWNGSPRAGWFLQGVHCCVQELCATPLTIEVVGNF